MDEHRVRGNNTVGEQRGDKSRFTQIHNLTFIPKQTLFWLRASPLSLLKSISSFDFNQEQLMLQS